MIIVKNRGTQAFRALDPSHKVFWGLNRNLPIPGHPGRILAAPYLGFQRLTGITARHTQKSQFYKIFRLIAQF